MVVHQIAILETGVRFSSPAQIIKRLNRADLRSASFFVVNKGKIFVLPWYSSMKTSSGREF